MPLLSSHTLILTHSLTCLTTAFLLLTSPSTLTASGAVWLLGEAMHIRATPNFSTPSEPLATAGLVLSVLAVMEVIFSGGLASLATLHTKATVKQKRRTEGGNSAPASRPSIQAFAERAAVVHTVQDQWITVSILKSLTFGAFILYSYLTSSWEAGMGAGYDHVAEALARKNQLTPATGLQLLNTRFVFAGLFVEMMFWGYLWTNLKEERNELAARIKIRTDEARESGEMEWTD